MSTTGAKILLVEDSRKHADAIVPLWQVEQAAITDAIEKFNGNVPRAAAALEVSASTLYRKLQRWEKNKVPAVDD